MTSPGNQVVVGSVAVEVTASARGFARSLRREMNEAFRGAGTRLNKVLRDAAADAKPIKVQVEPVFDQDAFDKATSRVNKRITLPVEPSTTSAAKAGVEASEQATRAAGPIRLKADVDRRSLGRVVSALAGVAAAGVKLAGVLAVVGAIGSGLSALLAGLTALVAAAIPALGQLVSVLVAAAGAFVILPGAIAGLIGVFATLKVATSGVGEAFKAAAEGGQAFEEALSNLAPAAADFVRQVTALRSAFEQLRLDVQQALFEGLGDAVTELANAHLATLQSRMTAIATSLNSGLLTVIERLTTEQAKLDLRSIFTDTANSVHNLVQAFGPLVDIIRDVTTVGAAVFAELTAGAADSVGGFAERIAEMRESGGLRQLILDGLDALRLLGSALGDLVGILRGVFRAVDPAEGGVFGFLERLNELVNSAEGQETLVRFFTELARIGEALMPVLLALGDGIAIVARAIGDIAVATAPALAEFLPVLAEALASLAPGFIALAPGVVALGEALLPVGKILADLVVGLGPGLETLIRALGEALELLVPAALPLAAAVSTLVEALVPLLPTLAELVAALLPPLATLLVSVADILPPLVGYFVDLVKAGIIPLVKQLLPPLVDLLGEVADMLAGHLADVLPATVELFFELVEALLPLLPALFDIARALLPLIPPMLELARVLLPLMTSGFQVLLPVITALAVPLLKLVAVLLDLAVRFAIVPVIKAVTFVLELLAGVVETVVGWVSDLVGWLGQLDWDGIAQSIGNTFITAWETVSGFFSDVFGWFRDLPGNIGEALGNVANTLLDKGEDLVGGLLDGLTAGFEPVKDWLGDLPGRIKAAIGNLGSLLFSTGEDAMRGLGRGISRAAGAVASEAAGAAKGVVKGVKAELGISSPSKVFADQVGKEIPAGIALGIRRSTHVATAAVDDLAARFTARFASSGDLARLATPSLGELSAATAAGSGMEVHLHNSDATLAHLEALQARQEALARVGRPR